MVGRRKQGVRDYVVDGSREGQRLDAVLAAVWPDISRSSWVSLIKNDQVLLDSAPAKPSQSVLFGSSIVVLSLPAPKHTELVASAQGPDTLYKDEDVIVIFKPAGLIVHPTVGSDEPSVVGSYRDQIADPDTVRPGVVHRLDRDTSGVMVLARNPEAKKFLQAAFRARKVKKTYWALVWGNPGIGVKRLAFGMSPAGGRAGVMRVDPLGKPAETIITTLTHGPEVSLVEARPITGRTHQIRVHLTALGFPILGDKIYGKSGDSVARQMLHARELSFTLPSGEHKSFEASVPPDFQSTMEQYSCLMPQ